MKKMHDKEFAALLELPAQERYDLFVRRVVDWEEVWSLRTDQGWSLMANDDGVELVPVWPHQRFADACADTQKQEISAVIPLEHWLNRWLPGIKNDGRQVTVFPVPKGKGVIVPADQLQVDLLAECQQYE